MKKNRAAASRRRPLKTLLSVALALGSLCGAGGVWSQAKEVVIQDPGGTYGENLRRLVYDPFTKETGIQVLTVQEARGGPRIKAQVEARRTEWDLGFIFDQEVRLLDPYLAEIDYTRLSPEAQKTIASLPKEAVRPKGVALQVIGVALVYNKDAFPSRKYPKTWADFWTREGLSGQALPAAMVALRVRVGAAGRRRRARQALPGRFRPRPAQDRRDQAARREVVADQLAGAAVAARRRSLGLPVVQRPGRAPEEGRRQRAAGADLDQAFTYYDFFSIPKNAPHPEAVLQLLSYRLDAQRAARVAEATSVALPSPRVYAAADPKLRDYWTNSPEVEKKAIKWNADFWGAKAADGTTNEEFAQQKLNQLLAR